MINRLKHAFAGQSLNRHVVISVALICCLLVGGGIYYMATVDAMNPTLDYSWIWFLGAAIAFIGLELYFGHGDKQDKSQVEINPDGSDQYDL